MTVVDNLIIFNNTLLITSGIIYLVNKTIFTSPTSYENIILFEYYCRVTKTIEHRAQSQCC